MHRADPAPRVGARAEVVVQPRRRGQAQRARDDVAADARVERARRPSRSSARQYAVREEVERRRPRAAHRLLVERHEPPDAFTGRHRHARLLRLAHGAPVVQVHAGSEIRLAEPPRDRRREELHVNRRLARVPVQRMEANERRDDAVRAAPFVVRAPELAHGTSDRAAVAVRRDRVDRSGPADQREGGAAVLEQHGLTRLEDARALDVRTPEVRVGEPERVERLVPRGCVDLPQSFEPR